MPISTPMRAPLAASGAAIAATIAAERASWMPPANNTDSSAGAGCASSRSSWASHNAKLERGPT